MQQALGFVLSDAHRNFASARSITLSTCRPLDNHQRIGRVGHLPKAKPFYFVLALKPVRSRWNSALCAPVFMHQRECRLVTSSADAAPSAAAMPFTRVVLPAPRSPRNITTWRRQQLRHHFAERQCARYAPVLSRFSRVNSFIR